MPLNLMEIDRSVAQNRANEMQNQVTLQSLLKGQRDLQRETDTDAAYKNSYDPTANKYDNNKLGAWLSNANPAKGYEFQQGLKTQETEATKAAQLQKTQELEYAVKAADYNRNAMSRVTPDGSNWAQTRAHLIQSGTAGEQDLPEQYDPKFIQSEVMNAESFIKQNAPKQQKVGFTPSGVAYDENNPQGIQLGGNYAKPEKEPADNRAPVAVIDPNTGKPTYVRPSDSYGMTPAKVGMSEGYSTKPLPTTALKLQNETLDKLSIANNNNLKLSEIQTKIENGQLNLGLFSNLAGKALNYTGNSTESSRNLTSFKSSIEKLRNDSLRLNTGVQTDGDAQRAWNELFENINDKDVVLQRLKEIQEINSRGADLQKLQVDNIRSNYNAEPIDFTKYEAKPTSPAKAKPTPAKGGLKNIITLPDGRKLGINAQGKAELVK